MSELLNSLLNSVSLSFVERALVGGISASILPLALPAVRSLLGIVGVGILAFSSALWFTQQQIVPSYITAFEVGIYLSIPLLIAYELISSTAKSLEILRGSQMAEQLFAQERGGPIEFGLFLLFGSLFLNNGGAGLILRGLLSLNSAHALTFSTVSVDPLMESYKTMLAQVFPLAALGVMLELISGLFQRVSKKNLFGSEFSTLKVPLAILCLLTLLDSVPSLLGIRI